MNIVLIGYRGTGKTTVAARLARALGWEWIDSDVEIERAAEKSIAAIFAEDGEETFRDMETRTVNRLLALERHVVALGGGAVLFQENRDSLRRASHVVWLLATPETILARLETDASTPATRPNLTAAGGLQEIVDVLDRRTPIYRECATCEVDTEGKHPRDVVAEVLSRLNLTPDLSEPA